MKTAKLPPTPSRQIVNSNGGSRRAPKTVSEVSADVVQLALRSRFNPLRSLTPQLLATYIDNFFLGFIAYAALTWEWIERRDDVLRNVVAKRKKDAARLKRESLQREESDEAKAHAQALDEFYDNLTAVNAIDENERGGFSLLIRQMMDAAGKYYAVHEIVWQPGSVLTAELRFVPLWFFENRTGKLRFLEIPLGGSEGKDLEDGGWMVTKGDGLMEASSIAYMFKNMSLKDWVAYSDKFGTPGVLGQTNAAKGSDAGNAMRDAVRDFGQNWSGVVYGADGAIKEPISLVQAKGEGELPFPPLIERMDRAMSAVWRGADLSSMSRGGAEKSVGASVQQDESAILLLDDAAMLSDTLQHYVDKWVIWQKFGTNEPKAYSQIIVPERENIEQDLKIDELLLDAGAQLGERERLEYYGRPVIKPDDTPLHAPAKITERLSETAKISSAPATDVETLPNVATDHAKSLIENALRAVGAGVAADMHTVSNRLAALLEVDDQKFPEAVTQFIRDLPELSKKAIAEPHAAKAFEKSLSAALFNGLSASKEGFDQPMPRYAVGPGAKS